MQIDLCVILLSKKSKNSWVISKIIKKNGLNLLFLSFFWGFFFRFSVFFSHGWTTRYFPWQHPKLMCELRKFAGNAIVFMRNLMTELSFCTHWKCFKWWCYCFFRSWQIRNFSDSLELCAEPKHNIKLSTHKFSPIR